MIDPVTLAVIGGGLSAAQTVAQGSANRQTAKDLRAAGRLDRMSLALRRQEETRSLGRDTQTRLGAARTTTANRGITGNTAQAIEQSILAAALFDQRNIEENQRLQTSSNLAEENTKLSSLRTGSPLISAITGGLQGLALGQTLSQPSTPQGVIDL